MQNMSGLSSLIEFKDASGRPIKKAFYKPSKVVVATELTEVIPALKCVDEYVSNGFYAVGYVSYECAPAFDSALKVKSDLQMPLLWFGLYSKYEDFSVGEQYGEPVQCFKVESWEPEITLSEYEERVQKIHDAIAEGDTYQVNYTIRLKSRFIGNEFAFYEQLKNSQGSSYSAFLNTGRYRILSVSPELFFHRNQNYIFTKPMKGTVPRGRWTFEDEENKLWLRNSEKNRAENLMIVDLLRNDLSRVSKLGSVKVPHLFEIESYRTVHQMTSTISSEVKDGTSLVEVFGALFPCGSITGAPKSSTMKLIAELETSPRGVYCGAIGMVSPDGEMIFNVAIRTVVVDSETQEAVYGVGGGITWDSIAAAEYEEVMAKSKVLSTVFPEIGLIETMRLEDGSFYLLERHLKRLTQSCEYFSIRLDKQCVMDALEACGGKYANGVYKVRLVIRDNCFPAVEVIPLDECCSDSIPLVRLANGPISSSDIFLYHKTTNRSSYSKYSDANFYDVILWNENGELTEFTRGNLVALMNGVMVTPPKCSGLLTGTLREELLAEGKIEEKPIRIWDRFERLWFVNSVRGLVEVKLVDTQTVPTMKDMSNINA